MMDMMFVILKLTKATWRSLVFIQKQQGIDQHKNKKVWSFL